MGVIIMPATQSFHLSESELLLRQFAPLVRSVAARYTGRGAEYEDLIQEGNLALLVLAPKCKDKQWLAAYLRNRLPGYVRAAAQRVRKTQASALPEELENILPECESGKERDEFELMELLARVLTKEEFDLTQALVEGFTQKELAPMLGISQQAISARVKMIRGKLAPLVADSGGKRFLTI